MRYVALAAALALAACADSDPSCDELQAEYEAYLAEHLSCTNDDDCGAVGGTGTCGCAGSIGSGSGDAVRLDAADLARAIDRQFLFAGCTQRYEYQTCDAAPATVRCSSGLCVANSSNCNSGPDE